MKKQDNKWIEKYEEGEGGLHKKEDVKKGGKEGARTGEEYGGTEGRII